MSETKLDTDLLKRTAGILSEIDTVVSRSRLAERVDRLLESAAPAIGSQELRIVDDVNEHGVPVPSFRTRGLYGKRTCFGCIDGAHEEAIRGYGNLRTERSYPIRVQGDTFGESAAPHACGHAGCGCEDLLPPMPEYVRRGRPAAEPYVRYRHRFGSLSIGRAPETVTVSDIGLSTIPHQLHRRDDMLRCFGGPRHGGRIRQPQMSDTVTVAVAVPPDDTRATFGDEHVVLDIQTVLYRRERFACPEINGTRIIGDFLITDDYDRASVVEECHAVLGLCRLFGGGSPANERS